MSTTKRDGLIGFMKPLRGNSAVGLKTCISSNYIMGNTNAIAFKGCMYFL